MTRRIPPFGQAESQRPRAERHRGLTEAGHSTECHLFAVYDGECTCGAWQRNLELLNQRYREAKP